MIIDFHTHIYPDKIAERTINALVNSAKNVLAHTNGTLSGLIESMDKAGIDKSVILPVATRKGQFDTINNFALNINKTQKRLVSFGGIHPDDDDIPEKIGYLKENGFRGIKIHPDYTGTFIDDERYIKIISECAWRGLKVITHAGVDPAFDVIHCPPEKARAVVEKISRETGINEPFMIFAHLGGMLMHDDVMKYLAGTNCYIEISCSFHGLTHFCDTTDEDVIRTIKVHGADKILFGTDSPWNDQKSYVEHFKKLDGISDKEKDMILHTNAEKILSGC